MCVCVGSQLCTANPGFAQLRLRKPRPCLALSPPLVRSSQASELFASEGSCRSFLVCIRTRYTLRCVSEPRSHAFSLHETCIRILATRSSLNSGKQSASLQRPSNSEEKVCVSSRLLRGAKFADLAQHTRSVCAIPGLLRGPRIRALRKKIRRWRESALCTSIMIGTKCGFAPSSGCIVQTLDPSSAVVFYSASHVNYIHICGDGFALCLQQHWTCRDIGVHSKVVGLKQDLSRTRSLVCSGLVPPLRTNSLVLIPRNLSPTSSWSCQSKTTGQ